jgi:hypothetical protein
MPTTVCPTSLGSMTGLSNFASHIAFDAANDYLYVHDVGFSIKRYNYPTLSSPTTILSDATVAGIAVDASSNLYYVLNDGVGGDTTVYKDSGGGPSALTSVFGTTAAFGLTWHPVDDMLYVTTAFGGGTIVAVDPVTGADTAIDSGGVVPNGSPSPVPDGSLWFFADGNDTVNRVNVTTGARLTSAADTGLTGQRETVPTISSTVLLNDTSGGDKEYGPGDPTISSAYACSIGSDIIGACQSPDWTRIIFQSAGFNFFELILAAAGRRWTVGAAGWSG